VNPPARVGLQLYTVREAMDRDVRATLRRVADLGFAGVELAGLHGLSPGEFRALLDDLGLTLISAMVGLAPDGLAPDTLEFAVAIGTPRLVVNAWEPDFATADAIDRLAESFNAGLRQARGIGIELGYHNHFWEFRPSAAGANPLAEFASRIEGGFFELDIYWLSAVRADWAAALAPLARRVRTVHVKDGPGTLPTPDWQVEPMTPAGTGTVDVVGMLAALPAAEWHVVEFDECAGDVFAAIGASRRFLVESGCSRAD
jgi:sugar phosphate isomerase/epimerase